MVNPFRVGSSSAGHAPDENDKPATSIAAPEAAAQYFHRLRLYNLSVVGGSLLACMSVVPFAFLHGWLWRVGLAALMFLAGMVIRLSTSLFFRCPVCDYQFETGRYYTEPKWHACPNCHTQFTAKRTLRCPPL